MKEMSDTWWIVENTRTTVCNSHHFRHRKVRCVWYILCNVDFRVCLLEGPGLLDFAVPNKPCVKLYHFSNEDMILALAGQFKQLSHEPEKFR